MKVTPNQRAVGLAVLAVLGVSAIAIVASGYFAEQAPAGSTPRAGATRDALQFESTPESVKGWVGLSSAEQVENDPVWKSPDFWKSSGANPRSGSANSGTASSTPSSPLSGTASPTSSQAAPLPTVTLGSNENGSPSPTASLTPPTQRPPSGNSLANPYFEGTHNSTSIPGWISDGRWDISIKGDNPSPPASAARTAGPGVSMGQGHPGENSILYQIVQGGGSQLSASIACVQINGEAMQVTILGSQSSGGPWTPVWQPFNISGCNRAEWGPALHAQTQLSEAWAFYMFQIVARFEGDDGAVKVTNASLSIQ